MTALPKYVTEALDAFQAAARGAGMDGTAASMAQAEAQEESARVVLETAISRAITVEKSLEVLGPAHAHNWVIIPGTGYKRQVCVGNLPDNPACGEERDTPAKAQEEAAAWAHFDAGRNLDTTKMCDRPLATGGNCGRAQGHTGPHKRVG